MLLLLLLVMRRIKVVFGRLQQKFVDIIGNTMTAVFCLLAPLRLLLWRLLMRQICDIYYRNKCLKIKELLWIYYQRFINLGKSIFVWKKYKT